MSENNLSRRKFLEGTGAALVVDGGVNTGNIRFRVPEAGFSGPSFER